MSYSIRSIKKEFAERGVFYTDERLARLLADEVSKYGEVRQVYDPTCGAGNLLAAFGDDVEKFGQEINAEQAEVARQRLTNAHIVTGDTLVDPAFAEMKFSHIVANYPFSIKWQPAADMRWMGAPCLPPPSRADYAFILHIISMMAPDGVAATLNFPGILYRGAREGKIREWLVRRNLIDSVTIMERGYFEDTNIETALIIFKMQRDVTSIKFADHASGREYTASFEEVERNGFTLSPSTYIVVEDDREPIDPIEVEMQARAEALRYLNAQLAFSKHAIAVHELLGMQPLPPLSEFINDIIKLTEQYK